MKGALAPSTEIAYNKVLVELKIFAIDLQENTVSGPIAEGTI